MRRLKKLVFLVLSCNKIQKKKYLNVISTIQFLHRPHYVIQMSSYFYKFLNIFLAKNNPKPEMMAPIIQTNT